MNVMLFLGSGVSVPSGMPSVAEITDVLLSGRGDARVAALLGIVKEVDRDYLVNSAPYKTKVGYTYSGQVFRSISTYEDIFYLLNQIHLNSLGFLGDATAGAFSEAVRRKAKGILRKRTRIENLFELETLAHQACRFIEGTIAEMLYSTTVRGMNLIVELAALPAINRLFIVTLNHDTLVEQLLAAHAIPYVDGFSNPDGDVRWFDDDFERSDKVVLLKPHGSISWFRSWGAKIVQPVLIIDRRSGEWRNAVNRELVGISAVPSFLTGVSKVSSYNRDIFACMLFQFQAALRTCELMIMSGYGWGDTPINFHLSYWLERSAERRLVLLHREPQSVVDRSKELAEIFDSYSETGRITVIRKWLAEVELPELKPYLAACSDLRHE